MNRSLALSPALCALLFLACDNKSSGPNLKHNREGGGTPVATWDHDSITQQELTQHFLEMSPFARTGYQTLDKKKEYVEGMARFELLAAEAARRGLQNDPEVIETTKKVMVNRLLQQEFEEKAGKKIEDADLSAYYQKHLSDYVKPEMVRMTDIFLASAKDAPDRAQRKAKAEEVQKEAAALQPMDFAGFNKLVREHSDDPKTKPLDGDMRFMSKDQLTESYGKEVADATDQLKKSGEVSNVVETDKGFYIFKLQNRQSAMDLKMESVKPQLTQRILYERKTQGFGEFVGRLMKEENYKLDEDALNKVAVDLKAPTQQPKGPPPGFIPAPNAIQ